MVFRFWPAFLVLTFGLSAVIPAQAQSVTPGTNVQRREGRAQDVPLTTITYEDCLTGGSDPTKTDKLRVPLLYTLAQGKKLQVWAGTTDDCADDEERVRLGETICWQVDSGDLPRVVDIPVRAIISAEGAANPTSTAVCEAEVDNSSLSLFFLLVEGTQTDGTQFGKLAVDADLVGPGAPSGVGLRAGEDRLFASFDGDSDDTEADGHRVYCEEALDSTAASGGSGGTAGTASSSGGTSATGGTDDGNAGDASVSGGASTSGGTTGGSSSCAAANLRPGSRPSEAYRRGRAGRESTQIQAEGLKNYVEYACGIAAFDEYNNVGPLSELRCATPEAVTDYFEAYRAAGGKAGGGFCSFGRAPSPSWSLLGLAALALGARRFWRSRGAA